MMNEFLDLERWLEWFSGLDREFVFLLALPFVVAVIGLWSALAGSERLEEQGREAEGDAQPATAQRAVPERRRRIRRREDMGRVAQQPR